MKRMLNPSVDELNALYELARHAKKILVEVMDSTNSGIHGWDYEGNPESNQVIYLLSQKELACWKHIKFEIIINGTI